jgi:hypothetical protein
MFFLKKMKAFFAIVKKQSRCVHQGEREYQGGVGVDAVVGDAPVGVGVGVTFAGVTGITPAFEFVRTAHQNRC